jgi:hypothetical protein
MRVACGFRHVGAAAICFLGRVVGAHDLAIIAHRAAMIWCCAADYWKIWRRFAFFSGTESKIDYCDVYSDGAFRWEYQL